VEAGVMTARRRLVRVPATSANLGPGYDVMAAAVSLHLELEVEETGTFSFDPGGLDVPTDRSNLLVRAFESLHSADGISFTLRGPMEPVYDRLRLAKGPSFGMKTTLICPFMYLAHYDLVTAPAGIAELAASKLDPDLLRLCCGTEPAAEIIEALAEALG
jgi:hypothetical protein